VLRNSDAKIVDLLSRSHTLCIKDQRSIFKVNCERIRFNDLLSPDYRVARVPYSQLRDDDTRNRDIVEQNFDVTEVRHIGLTDKSCSWYAI